ncbi:cyclopropane fatty acyl phospholipid synthase [Candidatus Rickettsiella viridis]|uniref:Cyclopropane fatty acyl phospholipid synthase n=1 Tax=Candidatus Rickettsiella viridis TaxID=676208 RepID=A0A2Z5UUB3_9COXI|nr:class I SAM-dependent methyltransferase [Candidatus Rickettsiella viridis]BBB14635.1 cyclopropane fatty acyl phospholipid synthase [Candidatus Rickettsiella viridis]
MPQNIYDNPDFFGEYSQLNRSKRGLEGAPEWPALCAQLPLLKNLNIVDLGCGYGWFCRYAKEQGAAQVLGIDISEKMIEKAKTMPYADSINYRISDMEQLALPQSTFNLVYSSLTLHYIENISELLKNIYDALVPDGHFVFSLEHPIYTAPIQKNPDWIISTDGKKSWPVNHYQQEGERIKNWLGKAVKKQHRTLGTYLNLLIQQGFTLSHVEEWGPSKEQLAAIPELMDERERPMLLLIAAHR